MPVYLYLPFQGGDLGVSPLDQTDKLSNHARAFGSKGGESPVPICKIPAGSGVAGKLGTVERTSCENSPPLLPHSRTCSDVQPGRR